MITVPAGVRIYLACGVTDMRRGFDGLSMMAQDVLKQDPFSGAIFCFRGRRGDLVKVLYWDGIEDNRHDQYRSCDALHRTRAGVPCLPPQAEVLPEHAGSEGLARRQRGRSRHRTA